MRRDVGAAIHLIRGQINALEQTALSLWYQAQQEPNLAAQTKQLDEHDACLELMAQYEELLKRAAR